jgi:polygalacturonase
MKRASRHIAVALAILVATGTLLFVALLPGACGASTKADLNVRSYGAKGDGKTDDTAAFVRASKAAVKADQRLFVPAGVYRLGDLTLPAGVTLTGAGQTTTWLKGRVDFGSNQLISDLKIGPDSATNCAVHNLAGATNTVFERCRFRGGGGEQGWVKSPVVSLGCDHSCSHITFRNCQVERNLGTEKTRNFANDYNDMSIDVNRGVTVSYITFAGCHVGVSNGATSGRAIGSPRMGLECWSDGSAGYPWGNITLRNCVFEATDTHAVDFSDSKTCRCSGVLIDGCTFKGAGKTYVNWGSVIDVECPAKVVIRNSTVYRGWEESLHISNCHSTGPAVTVTGNTFNLDYDNGIKHAPGDPIDLEGQGNVFTGNTVICHLSSMVGIVDLNGATGSSVTGNTFHVGSITWIKSVNGSSSNTTRPNTGD